MKIYSVVLLLVSFSMVAMMPDMDTGDDVSTESWDSTTTVAVRPRRKTPAHYQYRVVRNKTTVFEDSNLTEVRDSFTLKEKHFQKDEYLIIVPHDFPEQLDYSYRIGNSDSLIVVDITVSSKNTPEFFVVRFEWAGRIASASIRKYYDKAQVIINGKTPKIKTVGSASGSDFCYSYASGSYDNGYDDDAINQKPSPVQPSCSAAASDDFDKGDNSDDDDHMSINSDLNEREHVGEGGLTYGCV